MTGAKLRDPSIVAIGAAVVARSVACARSPGSGSETTVVGSADIPSSITLTPQSIVIKDGQRAVKSVSTDGATIVLSAASPGTADIKAGSIVLIRDVVVVKATAVRRDGDTVVITAEPAAITELIKNGEISWSRAKVDFRRGAIHTSAPSYAPAVHGSRPNGSALPVGALFLPPLVEAADEELLGKAERLRATDRMQPRPICSGPTCTSTAR